MDPQNDNANAGVFVAIYTRYERDLFRFVATLVPDRSDAEDVAQETARVLWQKFSQYDPDRPFLPWAYTVARFEVLNYLHRKKTHRKYFSAAVVEKLAEQCVVDDERLNAQRVALGGCLKKLSGDERQLLAKRYSDPGKIAVDTSQADNSQKGRTANALYKRLGRIRNKVAECVRRTLTTEGWT